MALCGPILATGADNGELRIWHIDIKMFRTALVDVDTDIWGREKSKVWRHASSSVRSDARHNLPRVTHAAPHVVGRGRVSLLTNLDTPNV
jgi:hypothetical protein